MLDDLITDEEIGKMNTLVLEFMNIVNSLN